MRFSKSQVPSTFSLYSGDDSLTLPLLAIGGCGVVSVASHLVGNRLQTMIQAFEAGKIGLAAEEHLSLFPLFKALFLEPNPIPVKAALSLQGWQVGSLRSPLVAASDAVQQELKALLQQLL